MKLTIEYKSQKPIYQQIYEQITFQILNGELEGGFCLPSIRSLAREIGVSIITIKTAYENLEQDGYIHAVQGKGFYTNNNDELKDKREALIRQKLVEDFRFYKSMGLSEEELCVILKNITLKVDKK